MLLVRPFAVIELLAALAVCKTLVELPEERY